MIIIKILITVASGFIGSTVVNNLYAEYTDIRAIDNFSIGTVKQIKKINVNKMDVKNKKDVNNMVKDVDIIIHFAGMTGIPLCANNPQKAAENNFVGTKNLIDAAIEEGVSKFIYASSFAVYGHPPKMITENSPIKPVSVYGNLRRACEHLVNAADELYDMSALIFRQSNMFGKGLCEKRSLINILADRILDKKPMKIFGDGTQVRNFLHVRDTAESYKIAIESGISGTYNLGGYENISVNEVVKIANEVSEDVLGYTVPVEYYKDRGPGKKEVDLDEFTYDISKLKNDTDFDPKLTVRDAFYELLDANKS